MAAISMHRQAASNKRLATCSDLNANQQSVNEEATMIKFIKSRFTQGVFSALYVQERADASNPDHGVLKDWATMGGQVTNVTDTIKN